MNLQVDNGKELQRKNLTVDECDPVTFDRFQLTSPAGNRLVLQIARQALSDSIPPRFPIFHFFVDEIQDE